MTFCQPSLAHRVRKWAQGPCCEIVRRWRRAASPTCIDGRSNSYSGIGYPRMKVRRAGCPRSGCCGRNTEFLTRVPFSPGAGKSLPAISLVYVRKWWTIARCYSDGYPLDIVDTPAGVQPKSNGLRSAAWDKSRILGRQPQQYPLAVPAPPVTCRLRHVALLLRIRLS